MTIVTTHRGKLQGEQGREVVQYRGIQYAAAARFERPAAVASWTGARDATRHGPIAPQPASRLRVAMGDFARPQAEDCLTLTVSTPAADGARRPVLVWLHGGAYWTGAGSLDWYDGAALAAGNDVVVVGVNYRLGALGFLAHPELSPGNLGLADMQAALSWVRNDIAAFGGDPDNITLIGQSAGAHAILWLLTRPETDGLFHRAILMSAPSAMPPQTAARAAEYAEFIASLLGTTPAGLRTEAVPRLLDAGVQLARGITGFADVTPPFMPVSDTLADEAGFIGAAAHGAAMRKIDLIIGTTREEMHAFFAADPAMEHPDPAKLAARFADLAGDAAAIELYRRRRPGGTDMDLLGDLVTDRFFLFPSLALADAVTAAGGRTYVYQFDWAAPGNRFKACHCIDLPFLFGNPDAWAGAPMLAGGNPAGIAALSASLRASLTNFARSGDPAAFGLPWPEYRAPARSTMLFGAIAGPVGDPAAAWRGGF